MKQVVIVNELGMCVRCPYLIGNGPVNELRAIGKYKFGAYFLWLKYGLTSRAESRKKTDDKSCDKQPFCHQRFELDIPAFCHLIKGRFNF